MSDPAVQRLNPKQPFLREEFPQVVAALRLAKSRLWDGRGKPDGSMSFLCHAIHPPELSAPSIIQHRLQRMISARIEGHVTVTDWLESRGCYDRTLDNRKWISVVAAQAYRHRWLDAMIKEFGG